MKGFYQLQKYTGISSRHTCPNCGRKQEFTLYVDANNKPIDETCGRCNRESCGYHLPPSEFFKEHPEKKETDLSKWVQPKQPEVKLVDYLPISYIGKDRFRERNNLYRFFVEEFGKEDADRVFDLYRIGTSKHWRYENGLSTIFPQIDEFGRLRQIKVMAYNPITGKRLKKNDAVELWVSQRGTYVNDTRSSDRIWFAGKTLLNNQEANLKQTFFGCHLIIESEKIGIVESEKTAMIASVLMPSITWLATGGCNGCKWTNEAVSSILKGRKVVLYPDSGMYEKWKEKAQILKMNNVDVSVYKGCEDKPDNWDIADVLLEERKTEREKQKEERGMTIGEFLECCKELGMLDRVTVGV